MPKALPCILIADDDPEDLEMLSSNLQLKLRNVQIICASNGFEALQYLASVQEVFLPAMIIADYQMPVLNGLQLMRQLVMAERFRGVTKIMWSSSPNKQHEQKCLESGADRYFIKPSNLADLEAMLSELTSIFQHAVVRAARDIQDK